MKRLGYEILAISRTERPAIVVNTLANIIVGIFKKHFPDRAKEEIKKLCEEMIENSQ